MFKTLALKTNSRVEFLDITSYIRKVIKESNIEDGVCHLFVPHTTAAITLNENADPDVIFDITKELNRIIPFENNYTHLEGNSAAHLKASFFGFSETIIIDKGELMLGRWQGIYFCEFDGPRQRKLQLKII